MPYRRRYKSRTRRKKRYGRGKGRVTRKVVRRIAKSVALAQEEDHYTFYDWSAGISASTVTSAVYIATIAQGDTLTTRPGAMVTPTSLRMRYFWMGADASNVVRMTVIQFKKGHAAIAPVAPDFWPTNTLTPFTPQMTRDYKVLFDRTEVINSETGFQKPLRTKLWTRRHMSRMYWKLSSTAALTPDEGGCIALIISSDSGAVNHPKWHGTITLRYKV